MGIPELKLTRTWVDVPRKVRGTVLVVKGIFLETTLAEEKETVVPEQNMNVLPKPLQEALK